MNSRTSIMMRAVADTCDHFNREFHVTQCSFRTSDSINEQVLMLRFKDLYDKVVQAHSLLAKNAEQPESTELPPVTLDTPTGGP